MTATLATLLKVSDIRVERERRELARARQDHGIAERAVATAQDAARDLRQANLLRRAALRSEAMAGPRSLAKLREHLGALRELDAEEIAADAAITEAEAACQRAGEALASARRAFAAMERARERRRTALDPLIRAERRASEMREEREAEERATGPTAGAFP